MSKTAASGNGAELDALKTILQRHPDVLYITDPDTYEVLLVNENFERALGHSPVGRKCHKEFQGLDEPCPFCTNDIIRDSGQPHQWEFHNELLDRHYWITDQMIQWPDGRQVRFEIATDITDRKRAEQELATRTRELAEHRQHLEEQVSARTQALEESNERLQAEIDERQRRDEIIGRQTEEIMELSTPVLRVAPGVVLSVLIGNLDSQRTSRFLEVLLESVAEAHAEVALVDITGVPTVDTQTAQHITEAVAAVGLLGARVILTGIRPSIAQTLVHLGIDLSTLETCGSLSAGLRLAMTRRGVGTGHAHGPHGADATSLPAPSTG